MSREWHEHYTGPYQQKKAYGQNYPNPKPAPRVYTPDETLKTGGIAVERKTFIATLRENSRGRFLRITEQGGTKHSAIIIPAEGLAEFKKHLDEMVEAAGETHQTVPMEAPASESSTTP